MNDQKHCRVCGYLFDGAHDFLCAEVRGLREQVKELHQAVSRCWSQANPLGQVFSSSSPHVTASPKKTTAKKRGAR